jgi:hypothetical protein
MGRKPIGKVAMTAAERQRRRRGKLGIGGPKLDIASEARIAELEASVKALEAELAKWASRAARAKRKQAGRRQQPPKRLRNQSA